MPICVASALGDCARKQVSGLVVELGNVLFSLGNEHRAAAVHPQPPHRSHASWLIEILEFCDLIDNVIVQVIWVGE